MQITSGTSKVQSAAIDQFIRPGTTLSVLLANTANFRTPAHVESAVGAAAAVAADKQITAIPFCPIENKNVIKLSVRINGFSVPRGKSISMEDGARLKTLASLSGSELTLVLAKKDIFMEAHEEQQSLTPHFFPFHWMVALADANAQVK